MYGSRSPLIPIASVYAGGILFPLIFPSSLWIAFPISFFSLLGAFYGLFAKVPYPYRHWPSFFLLLAWFFAGMSNMAWYQARVEWKKGCLEAHEEKGTTFLRIVELKGRSGERSRYRAQLLPQELPVLFVLKGRKGEGPLPGDRLLCQGAPEPITGPKGPAAFDRKAFYAQRGIHYEMARGTEAVQVKEKGAGFTEPIILALRWREMMYRSIRGRTPIDGEELDLAAALWLGRKTELGDEVREDYADAGGMHVLAVSGLHVGMLYFMVLAATWPLKKLPWGKALRSASIVLLLWAYAMITGWSASVVRAVLMLSLYLSGRSLGRAPAVGNVIAASALLILLVDPSMVRDIGFLLSYSAVVSIVTLYPRLEELWNPPLSLLRWFWSLLSVSIAAQIGVLPIVLAVFGKFPLWFGVTNPVLLPLASVALYSGPIVGLSLLIPYDLSWLAWAVEKLLFSMNAWVAFVSGWEGSGLKVPAFGIFAAIILASAIGLSIAALYGCFPRIGACSAWSIFLLFLLIMDLNRERRSYILQHAGRDPPVTAWREGESVLLWAPEPVKGYRKKRLVEYWKSRGVTPEFRASEKEAAIEGFKGEKLAVLYLGEAFKKLPPKVQKTEWDLILVAERAVLKKLSPQALPQSKAYILLHGRGMPKGWEGKGRELEGKFHRVPQEGIYSSSLPSGP